MGCRFDGLLTCSKVAAGASPLVQEPQLSQQQQGGSWLGRMFTAEKGASDAKSSSARNPNLECDIQKSGFQPNTTDFNRPSAEEVAQMKAADSSAVRGDASQRRRIR